MPTPGDAYDVTASADLMDERCGVTRGALVREFATSRGIAGASMRLEPAA